MRVRLGVIRGTFAGVVVGAVLASVAFLAATSVFTLSPDEASDARASPRLPPATAPLRDMQLTLSTSGECTRDVETARVEAPTVPQGYRSKITAVAPTSTPATTGARLAVVSGQPVLAVVTDAVLYRDFTVGTNGPDVRAFEAAVVAAGAAIEVDGAIDAVDIATWRREFDPDGPTDRIAVDSLAAVPAGSEVGQVEVAVGDDVTDGEVVMRVRSSSRFFTCQGAVIAPDTDLEDLTLRVGPRAVKVAALVVPGEAGRVSPQVRVRPAGEVRGDAAQLVAVTVRTEGRVLTAPLSAVRVSGDGDPAVTVVEGSGSTTVPVRLGVTAQGFVELTGSTLQVGQQVQLFDPDGSGAGTSTTPAGK